VRIKKTMKFNEKVRIYRGQLYKLQKREENKIDFKLKREDLAKK